MVTCRMKDGDDDVDNDEVREEACLSKFGHIEHLPVRETTRL